jgi:hypothetical protein
MMEYMVCLILCLFLLLPVLLSAGDVSADKEYLDNFMRIRGDASGNEVVYHWTGRVYSYIADQKKVELFGFEGFNIARTVVNDNGFELLTREAAFFLDPQSGKILDSWTNPFNGKSVDVQQIWNDPVNQDLTFEDEYLPYIRKFLPSTDLGKMIVFNNDIFPFYPNPMPRKDYPDFSQSENYQSAEFFQFFVLKEDLDNKSLTSVPAAISWTRLSPWMPFMRMADRAGNLVFVCRGSKLEGGYKDLPAAIREYVEARHPEFSAAPKEWTSPNATSWTFFKSLVDQGVIPK